LLHIFKFRIEGADGAERKEIMMELLRKKAKIAEG